MARNKAFLSPGREAPFSKHGGIHLDHKTVRGPLPFFNPTQARFRVEAEPKRPRPTEKPLPASEVSVPRATINWRSRDNRKGRHALQVDRTHPVSTSTLRPVLYGLRRMCTKCPYWDVSYLIAVFFAVGCLIFILCGFFSWLPLVAPRSEFPGESVGAGVTAFIGATLFQVGAILLVFEACNENQTGCFGWAVHHIFEGDEDTGRDTGTGGILARADVKHCKHHHQRGNKFSEQSQPERKWTWWPSWYELKTHYIHEIGFVASMTLSIGATIFWISGLCALPGIYDNMSLGVARGIYWLTYLLGGILFITSSIFYMLENQRAWYIPAPHLLGWHIGVWNLIGSIGWTLAASLGYCTSSKCAYQCELTLIWASVAYFIGSMLQWYEAVNKYPVERGGKSGLLSFTKQG